MGDIAERIANVRREAEALKEKIKQKRDALADTTCKNCLRCGGGVSARCLPLAIRDILQSKSYSHTTSPLLSIQSSKIGS